MADNSNINPNNDNSIDPNKKRYVPSQANNGQKSSSAPYPQSLLNKDKHTPTREELATKFQLKKDTTPTSPTPTLVPMTPKDTTPNPTPIPISLNDQTSEVVETKNYRFEEKKEEYSIPQPIANLEQPKVINQEQKPKVTEQVIEPKVVEPTIIQAPIPEKVQYQAPNIEATKVEPTKVEVPKIETQSLNINNQLPPELENAANNAKVEATNNAETITQTITQKEEPVNTYVENKKFSLPGTDTDKEFKTKSESIQDELSAKFAPKVEVAKVVEPAAIEKPDLEEAKPVDTKAVETKAVESKPIEVPSPEPVTITPPKPEPIKIDLQPTINITPLPPEIENAVNVTKAENSATEPTKEALATKEEPVNIVKNEKKFVLPGTDTDKEFKTKSEQIRDDISSKFAKKVEVASPTTGVDTTSGMQPLLNINPLVVAAPVIEATKIAEPKAESIAESLASTQQEQTPSVSATEFLKNAKEAIVEDKYQLPTQKGTEPKQAPLQESVNVITDATQTTPNSIDQLGLKPLVNINDIQQEVSTDAVTSKNKYDNNVTSNVTASEFLAEQKNSIVEPKYKLNQNVDTKKETAKEGLIGAAVIGAGAISGAKAAAKSTDVQDNLLGGLSGPKSTIPTSSNSAKTNSGTNSSTQSSDPNRYISPAPQQSSKSGGKSSVETTTTRITNKTTTTKTGIELSFDVTRQTVRSSTKGVVASGNTAGGKKSNKGLKAGLIAMAALIGLQSGAALAASNDIDSGIFDGVNSDGTAATQVVENTTKANTNFLTDDANVGPKYQPTAISEFGQRQGTYDAEGRYTETPATNTNPNDAKPKAGANQNQNTKTGSQTKPEDGIPSLNNNSGATQTDNYADQGQYDEDGNLKQNVMSSDAVELNRPRQTSPTQQQGGTAPQPLTPQQQETNARNNAPGSIPTQQQPGGPAIPAPRQNAAPIPQSSSQENSADLSGKKGGSLIDKVMSAFIGVYVKQGIALLVLILLTLVMILSIALGGAYFMLAGVCSNGTALTAASALAATGNAGAQSLLTTCQAFTAFTGIGCGGKPDVVPGNGECIANYYDADGDTISFSGVKGNVKGKKVDIKEMITKGPKLFPDKTELILNMVAVYGTVGTENGFKTKVGACLGAFKICPKDFALVGITEDEGAFLNSPEKQMEAFGKLYNDRKAKLTKPDTIDKCVLEHFNDKGWIGFIKAKDPKPLTYQLLYLLMASGCPDKEDENKVKNEDYATAGLKNLTSVDCTRFKEKIKAVAYDGTNYWSVAKSISSIGSYIGNGLNKYNLNIKSKAINGVEDKIVNPPAGGPDYDGSQGGFASISEQNAVIALLENKKIFSYGGDRQIVAYKADIQGRKLGSLPANGPIHINTAKFLIDIANGNPGFSMSSLGNNTHYWTPAWHNTKPIKGVDIAGLEPYGNPDKDSEEKMRKFFKLVQTSGTVSQILMSNRNTARAVKAGNGTSLSIGSEGAVDGHYHISIKTGPVSSSIPATSVVDCPDIANAIPTSSSSTPDTRLNKKSLTNEQWNKELLSFPRTPEFGDSIRKQVDYITSNTNYFEQKLDERVPMFGEKGAGDATNKIYALAEGAKYKFRNRAIVGEGEDRIPNKDPFVVKRSVEKQLKLLIAAMKLDGITARNLPTFKTNLEVKAEFEAAVQAECKKRPVTPRDCTAAEIASGSLDTLLDGVLKVKNVPNMSFNSTGHAINFQDTKEKDFKKSITYKYFTEDNQLNLARFGFALTYPDDSTDLGPLVEPNQIFYLGREYLEKDTKPF